MSNFLLSSSNWILWRAEIVLQTIFYISLRHFQICRHRLSRRYTTSWKSFASTRQAGRIFLEKYLIALGQNHNYYRFVIYEYIDHLVSRAEDALTNIKV